MIENTMADSEVTETVRCSSCKIPEEFSPLSGDSLYKWQMAYVALHETRGHKGYCYAWLDTALCPLSEISGRCLYSHDFPSYWTEEMKACHRQKKFYIDSLLSDDSESDNSSVDEDCTDSEEETYDLEPPVSLISPLFESPPSSIITLQHPLAQQIDSLLSITKKIIVNPQNVGEKDSDIDRLKDHNDSDNDIIPLKLIEAPNKCIISRINRKRVCENTFDLFESSTKTNMNSYAIRRTGSSVQNITNALTSEDKGSGLRRSTS